MKASNKGRRKYSVDENTPLINQQGHRDCTPLPKVQIGIILLMQLAEPITSQCIYPFINQLIRELAITGGDERKIGYYAGLVESLFFITQALTVLQWNRLSDRIGRKPVLLIGLFGLGLSMVCFGLSRTFLALVLSRCICGMLNGNSGVMKCMLGELTDSTNIAQAFSMIPIVWCAGAAIGPFIGGHLAHPHEQFPRLFSGRFWEKYPYFLPCIVSASFTAFTFLVVFFFLKETFSGIRQDRNIDSASLETARSLTESNGPSSQQHDIPHHKPPGIQDRYISHCTAEALQRPVPIRALLTYPTVLISIANYAIMALLEISLLALQPLFYSTPIANGGIGFPPAIIGTILGTYGIANGFFQMIFFSKIVRKFGAKRVCVFAMSCLLPIFALYPIMSFTARQRGVGPLHWLLMACQLILQILMEMSYASILMFVTSSSPNKHSLGTINGLGQTTASIARTLGPMMSTSLFAFSAQHNLMGGNAGYVVLFMVSCGGVWLSTHLPEELPERD